MIFEKDQPSPTHTCGRRSLEVCCRPSTGVPALPWAHALTARGIYRPLEAIKSLERGEGYACRRRADRRRISPPQIFGRERERFALVPKGTAQKRLPQPARRAYCRRRPSRPTHLPAAPRNCLLSLRGTQHLQHAFFLGNFSAPVVPRRPLSRRVHKRKNVATGGGRRPDHNLSKPMSYHVAGGVRLTLRKGR